MYGIMKKNKYGILFGYVFLAAVMFLAGCGRETYEFSASDADQSGVGISDGNAYEAETDTNVQDIAADLTNEAETSTAAADGGQQETVTPAVCYVHICGAVQNPGVYEVEAGSRLYEVIRLAGGLHEDAADQAVNQAGIVQDGMQIYIPTKEEVQNGTVTVTTGSGISGDSTDASGSGSGDTTDNGNEASEDGLVNINTADVTGLCTLPGIGETRAKAIIAYRETNGRFQRIEELMKVNGIKAGVYEKIKELIKVSVED